MSFIKICDTSKYGYFQEVPFSQEEKLETIIHRYNSKLSPSNCDVSIDKDIFYSWHVPMKTIVQYGSSILLFKFKITIFVQYIWKNHKEIQIDCRNSVFILKYKIQDILKIKFEYQELFFNDVKLTNKNLNDYGIKDGSIIRLRLRSFSVKVFLCFEPFFTLNLDNLNAESSILFLKQKIKNLTGLQMKNQKLELNECQLKDYLKISDYSITENSHLNLYFNVNEQILKRNLCIKSTRGVKFEFEVTKKTTVEEIKRKIGNIGRLRLTTSEKRYIYYEDKRKILDYRPNLNSKIEYLEPYKGKIFVKFRPEKITFYQIDSSKTVEHLKQKILLHENLNLPCDALLLYHNNILLDNLSFNDHFIDQQTILTLKISDEYQNQAKKDSIQGNNHVYSISNDFKGLRIEYKCLSKPCLKRHEIFFINYQPPLYYEYETSIKCPNCNDNTAKIYQIEFSNCYWRCIGKLNDGTMIKSSWKKVDKLQKEDVTEFSRFSKVIFELKNDYEKYTDEIACGICFGLENFQIEVILGCKHKFHKTCYRKWAQVSHLCPSCESINDFSYVVPFVI